MAITLNRRLLVLLACALPVAAALGQTGDTPAQWDEETAIRHSQAVIGEQVGDHVLTRTDGSEVRLSDYAGKPLLVSMIFTSCHHVCPMTTKRLDAAVGAARDVLGYDSFKVVTVGFDTANDSPQAMRSFARAQGVNRPNWNFLSASQETVDALAEDLGFIYYPSPRGFDHITQVSVIGRDGTVYSQVYGIQFELPWLVEPLKELVLNRPESEGRPFAGLVDRIRLFCTVYDPSSGAYHFDYSLFIQMAIGAAAILAVVVFLVRGLRRPRA
ncbi:MAG: redoxin domain-containing protein [Xanthomonadales bacterium]|nr:redoxin domain-containing protein [Xanthomonadales bacterium]NIX12075.1 redoxin domain-containing protein [Xanthomonadales bacterium]